MKNSLIFIAIIFTLVFSFLYKQKTLGNELHFVRDGDSLIRIARQYGVSVDRLAELNNLVIDAKIYPGLVLKIPIEASFNNHSEIKYSGKIYIVKNGEKLKDIANTLNVSLTDIKLLNNLGNWDNLNDGFKLMIPDKN